MKLKKATSIFCTVTMILSMVGAPLMQAQAYEIEAQQSSDGEAAAPVKPQELAAREAKNYKIEETPETFGDFLNDYVIIMPGDTFEYVPIEDDDNKSFYYVDDQNMSVEASYENEGFEITGTVDAIETFSRTFKEDNEEKTITCNSKWKNNTNCPITIEGFSSGSGPIVPHWGYSVRSITVKVYKPYYHIDWGFENTGMHWGDPSELFWAAGEYDTLTFPSEYWITDVPYTITVPKPTKQGEHFVKYAALSDEGDYIKDNGAYLDYTVCWNGKSIAGGKKYDFENYGDLTLDVEAAPGNTLTLIGNGGKIKGQDKWVIELPDSYDEEGSFKLADYAPVKDNDTFLGWCTKESALYGSFFTKDKTSDVFDRFDELGDYYTNNGTLYAKWQSDTEETLEKQGWELLEDGTLWLLNFDGQQAWIEACENDETLAPKVKAVKTGYKDDDVDSFQYNVFKDCVNLEEFATKPEQRLNSGNIFNGCTNLKKVVLDYQAENSVYYAMDEGTFEGAGKDLVVVVPEERLKDFKEMFPSCAYLFNADETDVRYPISVNGVVLTKNNSSVACGEGTASYDEETNTLTLENADMTEAFIPHFMPKYLIDEEENWIPYNAAAVVCSQPDLNIVLKGKNVVHTGNDNRDYPYFLTSYEDVTISGDGSMEASFYSENFLIMDPDTGESTPAPPSSGKLMVSVEGDLAIDGITATRLIPEQTGTLTIKNCTLDGGVYVNVDSITDTKINNFQGSYSGFGMPEDTSITTSGESFTIEKSDIERTSLEISDETKALTIKDSSIHIDGVLTAPEGTKLSIVNSSVEAWGQEEGVTNIPESSITLTDCRITDGAWDKSGYFKIMTESEINEQNPEEYIAVFDSADHYKGSGESLSADILGDTSKDEFSGTFVKLIVDSEVVDKKFYTTEVKGNRFTLTLSSEFLDGLALGGHSVIPVFEDGSAEYSIFIMKEESSDIDTENTDAETDSEIGGTDTAVDESDVDTDIPDGPPDVKTIGDYDCLVVKDEEGKDAVLIIGYNGTDKEVSVPTAFDEMPVISIGQQAFEHNDKIEKVILPEGLKHIGPMAFIDCPNLSEVQFPGFSIEDIGESAFEGCGLTSVRVPSGAKKIAKRAFANNPLTSVELEYGITEVGEEAFAGCDKLEEMFFSNSIEEIKEGAFKGCDSLKKITVIDKETKIDPKAFTDKDGNVLPLTVSAYAGSKAEAFANANDNVTFEEIDDYPRAYFRFGIATSDDVEITDGTYIQRIENPETKYPLPNAKIEGREFMGWYRLDWTTGHYEKVTELSEKTFLVGDSPENMALAMNIELFAVFEKTADSDAELILDANGGKLDGNDTCSYILGNTHGEKKLQVLDCFVPEKEGAEFVGWNTKPDGTGVMVNSVRLPADTEIEQKFEGFEVDEKTYVFLDGTDGKIQLYAIWNGGVYIDPTLVGMYGDIDGDEQITAGDALMVLRNSAGMTDFTPEQLIAGDVDFDGTISATDALAVLRYSTGMPTDYDVGQPILYTE